MFFSNINLRKSINHRWSLKFLVNFSSHTNLLSEVRLLTLWRFHFDQLVFIEAESRVLTLLTSSHAISVVVTRYLIIRLDDIVIKFLLILSSADSC